MDTSLQQYAYQPFTFDSLVGILQGIGARLFSFTTLSVLYVLLTLFTIALITLIIWLFVRMYEIRMEDKKKKAAFVLPGTMPSTSAAASLDPSLPVENKTWKGIRERLLGDNESDWKLAIIESDIYMDRLLDDKGFHGDTTSDKLKQVTPDKLPSVQIAWEVHKIRNRIAHDGIAFVITMPEARRLLSYYEIIFTDLGVL